MVAIILLSLLSVTKPSCEPLQVYTYVITQKFDNHTYEMVNYRDPSLHVILKTQKATFSRSGMPIGIKLQQDTGERLTVQMEDGFSRRVPILHECGLTPLPDFYAIGGVTFRNKIKGEK